MHPEIGHGDWYQIDICKVRFQTLFRYIKGITSKIDLFQFLCMASRSSPIQMCIRLYEVRSLNHNGIMFILPIRIVFLRLRPVFRVVMYSVSHRYHSHTLRNTNSIYLDVFIGFSVKPVIITLIVSLLLLGVPPGFGKCDDCQEMKNVTLNLLTVWLEMRLKCDNNFLTVTKC